MSGFLRASSRTVESATALMWKLLTVAEKRFGTCQQR